MQINPPYHTDRQMKELSNKCITWRKWHLVADLFSKTIILFLYILLQLNFNPFKDAGVAAILKAVEKHPKLHLLSIEVNIFFSVLWPIGLGTQKFDSISVSYLCKKSSMELCSCNYNVIIHSKSKYEI